MYHFVEPWRSSFQEIAEFLTGHQADVADDRVGRGTIRVMRMVIGMVIIMIKAKVIYTFTL